MKEWGQYLKERMEDLEDSGLSARERRRVAEAEYQRKQQQKNHRNQEDKLYEDLLLEQQEQM